MDLAPRISNIDKNYLMNGAMDLFQRFISPSAFTGVSLSTSFTFPTADRWAQKYAGTWSGGTPASCSSTNVPNQLSKYSLNFIGGPSVISDEVDFRQRIESIIASELSSQTVSIGLMINSDSPSQITLELWVPNAVDDYTSSSMVYTNTQAFANDSAWHPIVFNGITLPSVVNGLEVRFRIANNSNLISTNHVYVTQIGLMKNSTFTGFNRHGGHFHTDLRACQRYYEKSYDLETNLATVTNSGAGQWFAQPSLTNSLFTFQFEVRKRTVPTVVFYSPVSGSTGVAYNNSSGDISASAGVTGQNRVSIATTGGGGGSTTNYVAHFTADAEL